MTLFRCSTPKKRNSFKFLSRDEIHSVGDVLDSTVWFDHFHRRGGIANQSSVTRFGPINYPKFPLYACEKKDTTYYEFAYWKLKSWGQELNIPTKAATIQFGFDPSEKPVDVRLQPNYSEILDVYTYSHAHTWITSLPEVPESISYPSVRDPSPGGINFAIFSENSTADPVLLEELILTVISSDEVEILINNKESVIVKPIK